jgi:hypothetical protein
MRRITGIILHHTAGPPEQSVESIRRFHVDGRGWSDIGYHYVLTRHSGLWSIEHGRDLSRVGAHTRGQNASTIGVAVCGDWSQSDIARTAPTAYRLLHDWLVLLCRLHGLGSHDISGHRDHSPTLCPGFDHSVLRSQVARSLRVLSDFERVTVH